MAELGSFSGTLLLEIIRSMNGESEASLSYS